MIDLESGSLGFLEVVGTGGAQLSGGDGAGGGGNGQGGREARGGGVTGGDYGKDLKTGGIR